MKIMNMVFLLQPGTLCGALEQVGAWCTVRGAAVQRQAQLAATRFAPLLRRSVRSGTRSALVEAGRCVLRTPSTGKKQKDTHGEDR